MLIVLSHVIAFSALFVGSVFDLKTTEVPDAVSVAGVAGGLLMHFLASLNAGFDLAALTNLSMILNNPVTWLHALGDPLLWSLGVGIVFSIYGWGIYLLGMWGGADAFAMSVLGFAAPYSVSGFGLIHPVNLFLNIMLAGFIYTLVFAFYRASRNPEVWRNTWNQVKEQEARISMEILAAALIGTVGEFYAGFNGVLYFGFFVMLIFLYRFLNSLQEGFLSREVPVSDLEEGDIIEEDIDLGTHEVRRKNLFGQTIESTRAFLSRTGFAPLNPLEERLERLENRIGYPEIVGVTQEQIEEMEDREIDSVNVKEGIRFVPVFPIALVLTDVFGVGIEFIQLLVS